MSQGRIELITLLSSNQPISIYYWITLLNFFEEHQTDLDIDDVRRLVAECERCRNSFNTIEKNLDKIRKEDTRPNVYAHLEMLETKLEEYNTESLPTIQLVAVAQ